MVPSAWPSDALRKFASVLAQLFKSSLRPGRFVLRIFNFLLCRLGSIRVHFDRRTYSSEKPHEEFQPKIRASAVPVIQLPATDDDQPGEQRFHSLAVPMDISSPQYATSSHSNPSAIDTATGGGHPLEAPNASSGQPLSFPEPIPRSSELIPIIPTDVKRYERNIKMRWVEPKCLVINPQDNKKFVESVEEGWSDLVHPEGPMVYYHRQRRIFTDVDMRREKSNSQALLDSANDLMAYAKSLPEVSTRINEETELVLEVDARQDSTTYSYYFVDHATRMIFWAHPYTCEPDGEVLLNVKAAKKYSHISAILAGVLYMHRYHCELYPHNRYLPRSVFEELKEIIIHANAETITTDTSLAPFDGNELAKMLDLMDRVEGSIDKMHAHSVCVVARFMGFFTKVKFMNFCGQPGARVDADRSIYFKEGHERETLIFRLSNLILWYAPQKHHKRIRRVWVDEIINAPRWKNFIAQLVAEWTSFTLYSTVMLAVNVSFLPVPGTIVSSSQTARNLAIYMSALCAVGSLVVSMLLVGQSQDSYQTAEDGATYMSLMTDTFAGVENLALMHSLPFALLIWAMVFFGLALSIFIFKTNDVVTLATMTPGWVIVMVFTLWPVMNPVRWLLDLVTILVHRLKRVVQYLHGFGRSERGYETRYHDVA